MKKKHEFNIFPEMSTEEFNRLKEDIRKNGFDPSYPIMLYGNAILDGWNRYRACEELHITPLYDHFAGNDEEAMALVMRSNKRRSLSDERLVALALESDELMEAIRKQVEEGRREKLTGNDNAKKNKTTNLNSDSSNSKDKNENTTIAKIADTVGVKRNQVEKIMKLKKEDPEGLKEVANGHTDCRKLKKAKKAKLAETLPTITVSEQESIDDEPLKTEETMNSAGNQNPGSELTDNDILEYVQLAKIEVEELVRNIIKEETDYLSKPVNQPLIQEIQRIHVELGEVLTGYNNLIQVWND